ncbi:PREDICTED: DNA polymerase I B, chloroplastic/mitochondrial isoform X3 [Camelina sativa]|uniref:DNA polymerase I B, chloroplastic/mitochondrial isoform X1 n=1 Tax=Camelina sativa TaxID=90675 RepID=A0ABM0W666_CAMSA|nr:PREDICTED: DNA polymerase I B, chloroplastic/mitochondrial isoform X1 [Camelina sativa]XP_010466251.1 PREDICTED: DNA polymerase I B, chloroplastic/mitochondrial isoform X2 [Camelina sativa]XP_019092750.1 PREDICTED: DNA polymerase I B, chloroplastic/mitochondrial isoform X3 [Camelina sativa]
MGVSLRHLSPSSFWVSRRPRVSSSSSILSFLVPRRRIISRKIAIINGNSGYSTATTDCGGSHGFQHSGHQRSSSVEFSGEWKLNLGSKTARMVPPTVKEAGAVSAWRDEVNNLRGRNGEHANNNQDDAFGNGSYYFKGFVPKIDDVQSYGNGQNFDYKLKQGSDITTLDRELNGFMQTNSIRRPVVALPSKDIEVEGKTDMTLRGDKDAHGKQSDSSLDNASYKKSATVSQVEKCTNLSKVRANLKKIYERVFVVDDAYTAKKTVAKLMNEYRNLVHACDTEVSRIDVKTETPVDHGEMICFSLYCGSEADFGDGKSCIWVDLLGESGRDILAEFKPFFEDSSIKKVWHNYSFDHHIIRNYGIKLSGFHGDTMHMARLWDSSRRISGGYSLEALTSDPRVLGGTETKEEAELFGKISMKKIFGKGKLKKDGSEGKLVIVPPVEELQKDDREAWISYSALDSISTLKLYESMKKQLQVKQWFLDGHLISKKNMFDFYQEYWQPFAELLAKMEAEGILVDRDYLAQIEIVAKAEKEIAVSRFRNWASKHCPDAKHMNVGSDTQLRQLFFGGITNSCNGEDLPYEKLFKVPNVDKVIEEGKKTATKFRNIKLHRISDNPLPTEKFTASGWPSVSGDTLKALAGKVSAEYDYTDGVLDTSLEENTGDDDFISLPDEILETQHSNTSDESNTSAYGTAFDGFGGGESGKEACHAIAALCEVCSIDSLISNFILPLQGSNVSGKDGRVHCSLNINTETGRLSARRPNLQNQPALEKDRYKIRQAFIASPGNSLIVADYGQLELRILAHLTGCKSMMEAFIAGGDFHSRTAMNMYPHIREAVENGEVLLEWHPQPGQEKPPVPLLKDAFASERRKAKMLNFSIAYGKTAVGLSRDWKVSREEAQETVNLWYNDRQEVRKWQELRKKEAIKNGYVVTLLGRARKFPVYRSRAQKNHIERAAINTPVQGSAADVAMCAMLEISTNQCLKELGWKLLLQIHDEVILEGPSESAENAKDIVVKCMSEPFNGKNILSVDLSVDAKCAQNWYAGK